MPRKQKPTAKADNLLHCIEHDPGESGTYDWVKAIVDGEDVRLEYQCTGLNRQGRDGFSDDNLMEWSEDDIRLFAANHLGIKEEDAPKIEVDYA